MADLHTVIKVFLVNGDSRSVKLDEKTEVVDIIYYILSKLRANIEVAPQLFGIQLSHNKSGEYHWLTQGYSVLDLIASHCGSRPLDEWRFLLRIRVLPKTPQHLFSQDPIAFAYYYDQMLHTYLEDDSIVVDNDTALRLGCLEMRRFFRDMSQGALKSRQNFAIIEKEYGLEKFFKKSFLQSSKKRNLNRLIQTTFQQYETFTSDGCIFQFFAILGRFYQYDVERFSNCAIGDDVSSPLTTILFVGPNCDVEYETEIGERRFLVSFNDIHEIIYEPELVTRGKVTIGLKTSSPVVIRTAQLITSVHLSSLMDAYCQVYTAMPHSRLSNGLGGMYSQNVGLSRTSHISELYKSGEGDYDEIRDPQKLISSLGRPISPRDIVLIERLGEGQFGDVHKGLLYQDTPEETAVAIKTCKPDSTDEDRLKFLQEAAVMKQFTHPHIIKLFGVVTQGVTTYIVMELAPLGNLRQFLLINGPSISRTTLFEYIRQLCSAMVHLESKNYVHRDIAARNILVVTQDKIKLSDFGLSRWLEEQDCYVASKGKLPIKWMAPESINFRRFTGASDVWMFGVCIWEMLMRGIKPFTGIKNDEVIGKIEQGQRLHLPPECPGPLFNLMNQCWQYYPEERPTFRDIQHQIDAIFNNEKQFATQGRQIPIRKSPSGSHNHRLSQGFATEGVDEPPPPTLPPRGANMGGRPLPPEPSRLESRPLPPEPSRLESRPLPPEPPRTEVSRQPSHDSRPLPPNPSPTNLKRKMGSDSSVDPYMVTAIPGASSSSSSSPTQQLISPPSDANNKSFSPTPIPPPAILKSRDPPPQEYEPTTQEYEKSRPLSESIYYSTVADEMVESVQNGTIKSSQSSGQLRTSPQSSSPTNQPYEAPVSSNGTPQYNTLEEEEEEEEEERGQNPPEEEEEEEEEDNEELVVCTTAVVKAVMKLNNELPRTQPADYIDYVKEVGQALRELLHKVDQELLHLPEHTHSKVTMAHKVLSSDMANVVQKMKDLQQNYQSFLMDHYQKEMLQASTIVAVNSRVLLDAVSTAKKQRHKPTR